MSNKDKLINFVGDMIHDGVLSLQFCPKATEPQYWVNINIIHSEGKESIDTKDLISRRDIYRQLVRYFRKERAEYANNTQYELGLNGGH